MRVINTRKKIILGDCEADTLEVCLTYSQKHLSGSTLQI